jgi:predicted phosphodiesterase
MSKKVNHEFIRPKVTTEEYERILNRRHGKIYSAIPEYLSELPDGRDEVLPPLKLEGKTAVLCDIHFGVHDKQALTAAIQYARSEGVQNIVLNGDVIDGARISRHPKNPNMPKFLDELEIAKIFLKGLRADFPNARIVFKAGNHEDRLEAYLMGNAPEAVELITWPALLGLTKLGIEFASTTQFMRIAETHIIHGHEVKVGGGVNPARALLLKTFETTVMGHVHKTTFSHGRGLSGKYIKTFTVGCLCKTRQSYMPHSNSNQGFAIVNADGTVRNLWINNGVVE